MTKQKEIDTQCREIYEEIKFTCEKKLRLNFRELCEKAFNKMQYEDDILDDPREEKKYYEKYKKIFDRKNWENETATKRTLHNLEELRGAVYKTDEYRLIGGIHLPFKFEKDMKEISEWLEKELKRQDNEE
ncbi:MAG: hypothetical protein K0U19_00745 [Proteobacteria bacterium]|nr:hypothetical protein [Pseudomonadota bacterium]